MHISHLQLADFRSYHEVDLELAPGATALVGPNGHGKTNLIEAIGYAATLSSHRVPTDAPLIRAGAERAVVRVRAVKGERAQLVEIEITPGKANRARVNRSPVPRPRDVLGIIRTVLFAPEDLALVKGDPDGRRRFLDELLVLRQPRLAGVRTDYERILRQRGALLKSAGAARRASRSSTDLTTLDIWDGHLARTGAEVIQARIDLVDSLRPHVAASYEQVSSAQGNAQIGYRSSIESLDVDAPGTREELEEQLLQSMITLRSKEIERGVSLVGPHRDDLVLTLADLPAKGYASHGEAWSFALGLRLASYELLSHDSGPNRTIGPGSGEPVLILDDVFAELDRKRRDKLAELVAKAGQVIITAAVPEDVPPELDGVRINVGNGQVSRAS